MNVVIVATETDLDDCRGIRRRVFIEEQEVPEDLEWDGKDIDAQHLLIRDGTRPAGTLRIRRIGDIGKIERVAVEEDQRGKGIGDALVLKALEILRDDPGITRAKLGAQTYVIGFYEKFGFAAFGPVYDDAGIPHRDMMLEFLGKCVRPSS